MKNQKANLHFHCTEDILVSLFVQKDVRLEDIQLEGTEPVPGPTDYKPAYTVQLTGSVEDKGSNFGFYPTHSSVLEC